MSFSFHDLVAAFNSVTVTFPDTGPIRVSAQSFVDPIAKRWAELVPGRAFESSWTRYFITWLRLRYGETEPAVLLYDLWLQSRPYQSFHETMAPPQLPAFLATTWQFHQRQLPQRFQEFLRACDCEFGISELAMAQIVHQTTAYDKLLADQELSYRSYGRNPSGLGVQSLLAMSAGQLISLLENSDEFTLDLTTLATNVNSSTVLAFLRDSRLPYVALRSFMALSDDHALSDDIAETAKSKIDIDEAILVNEAYIRSRGVRNKDHKGLVSLSDANIIFGNSSLKLNKATGQTYRVIVRNYPPKGGFEFFDAKRPRILRIQPSQEAFNATFNRLTRYILEGLNWDNVFIAGGMILTTLLHVDPARDDEVQDNDIDLYIYGLTPAQANDKVREIYNVWSTNLPAGNNQKLIVKNVKTITFLADYPNRRIQIILKIVPCPTTALLNFDLDPCAVGFDGKNVLMLPRCARALETGYSTFTMDLLWGHHLGDRRATQSVRVLKYADRGFGIRILPSYVKSLEEDYFIKDPRNPMSDEDNFERRLDKKEPGLKTLKRIEYLGQDMVHRFYFGNTPLAVKPEWMEDDEWQERIRANEEHTRENEADGDDIRIPLIKFADLDTRGLHMRMPGGRRSVGGFEIWMRHHEAWKLDSLGKARLDKDSLSSNMYDAGIYDDLPSYNWNSSFNAAHFEQAIDEANGQLFDWLKQKICHKLGTFYRQSGWKDYLTRKIRRQFCGSNIDQIFEKQITIPIDIPFELEDFINTIIDPILEDKNIYNGKEGERQFLIPVHELGKGNAIIPDLVDSHTRGNMRYWVIGNEIMWAGIDRGIDEVSEVLWTIFHWLKKNSEISVDDPETLLQVALAFRSRLPRTFDLRPLKTAIAESNTSTTAVPPPIGEASTPSTTTSTTNSEAPETASVNEPSASTSTDTQPKSTIPSIEPTCLKSLSTLSEAEKRLFQQWAFHVPLDCTHQRHYTELPNDLYFDAGFLYPFPDDLFWGAEDDAIVAQGVGVEWVDVPANEIVAGIGIEFEVEIDVAGEKEGKEAEGGKEGEASQGLAIGGGKRKREVS